MSPIVPAIIPKTFEDLRATLEIVAPFTHEVQVDIVDGVFVPFTSWPYHEGDTVDALAEYTESFLIEVDLMVKNPETVIESYLRAGVRRAIVHLESTEHLAHIVSMKERYDFKLGLSISNNTDLSMLEATVSEADYVQLMGIADIGSQGQPFDTRVLARITEIKKVHPNLLVSIDGSVNEETLPQLLVAGADRFVSGSAILAHENPKRAFELLRALCRNT